MANTGASNRHFIIDKGGVSPWLFKWAKTTNFATESIRQDFTTEPSLGNKCSVIVGRLGDLLAGLTLEMNVTSKSNYFPASVGAYHPAEALVKSVQLIIGGTEIERHTPDFFRVYDSFLRDPSKAPAYKSLTNFDAATINTTTESTETLYLPLMFTFCRHVGSALPLVSLRDSEVKVVIEFATASEAGISPDNFSATMYADFIYLDTHDRRTLVANSHEYLIEQIQYNEFNMPDSIPSLSNTSTYDAHLKFFRPVKSIYWMMRNSTPSTSTRTHHGRYVGDAENTYLAYQPNPFDVSSYGHIHCISERLAPIASAQLTLDGQTRFIERPGSYFELMQSYQFLPRSTHPGMYSFSFALEPADLQPSGACNFSSIEHAVLRVVVKKNTTKAIDSPDAFSGKDALTTAKNIQELRELIVIAVNYNILKVQSGRAGLVF